MISPCTMCYPDGGERQTPLLETWDCGRLTFASRFSTQPLRGGRAPASLSRLRILTGHTCTQPQRPSETHRVAGVSAGVCNPPPVPPLLCDPRS